MADAVDIPNAEIVAVDVDDDKPTNTVQEAIIVVELFMPSQQGRSGDYNSETIIQFPEYYAVSWWSVCDEKSRRIALRFRSRDRDGKPVLACILHFVVKT